MLRSVGAVTQQVLNMYQMKELKNIKQVDVSKCLEGINNLKVKDFDYLDEVKDKGRKRDLLP